MDTYSKIVLLGLPGSGKTTLGKELARVLGFEFYDLDDLIEKKEGYSIAEVFVEKGEGYFRKSESSVLEKTLKLTSSLVLSTGGGTPCFNDNMEIINRYSVSVYLDVPLRVIFNRLTNIQIEKRPLFRGLEPGELILKLKSMLEERAEYYLQAKIKPSGEDISTELLLSELIGYLKTKPN